MSRRTIAFDQSYDEIQQLMSAFMTLANRVDELQRELQSQVGRYTRNLDIAAIVVSESERSHVPLDETVASIQHFADDIDVIGLPRLPGGLTDHPAFAQIAARL